LRGFGGANKFRRNGRETTKEIRFHGRGGQGTVVAMQILATAVVGEGKYAAAFPTFGFERRGAPVAAFCRMDDKPIRERMQVYRPDCLVVIDPGMIKSPQIFNGVKEGAILVLNAVEPIRRVQYHKHLSMAGVVDATKIGLEEIGTSITNTCMLGAFSRATDWVQLDSLLASLEEFFSGAILEKNIRCVERGFKETTITQY